MTTAHQDARARPLDAGGWNASSVSGANVLVICLVLTGLLCALLLKMPASPRIPEENEKKKRHKNKKKKRKKNETLGPHPARSRLMMFWPVYLYMLSSRIAWRSERVASDFVRCRPWVKSGTCSGHV